MALAEGKRTEIKEKLVKSNRVLVAKQTSIKQETSLHMYTNQRPSQVQQQSIIHYAKTHDPYTFIDILNSSESRAAASEEIRKNVHPKKLK